MNEWTSCSDTLNLRGEINRSVCVRVCVCVCERERAWDLSLQCQEVSPPLQIPSSDTQVYQHRKPMWVSSQSNLTETVPSHCALVPSIRTTSSCCSCLFKSCCIVVRSFLWISVKLSMFWCNFYLFLQLMGMGGLGKKAQAVLLLTVLEY